MALLPPRVDGPLSECSSSVRVEGQITGATVELYLTGHPGSVGGGVATWSDQTFPLFGGVHLTPSETVQALQRLGADASPLGPGITVQKKPPVIGPLVFQSHLYVCGSCLWLTGRFRARKLMLMSLASLAAPGSRPTATPVLAWRRQSALPTF